MKKISLAVDQYCGRTLVIHGALVAFLTALTVPAVQAEAEQSAGKEIIVVSATRAPQPIVDAPSNIAVIALEQLELSKPEHIQQVLSQVPGVATQRGDGQESLPGIRSAVLTGAGACGSVLVLEEGIPVRGPAFCNVNELFDTHYENASQVEVTRGPGSAFYGSNSLTGSVNVRLSSEGENRAALELGSNSYRRASAAVSYGQGSQRGRFYLSAVDTGSFRDEAGYQQQKLSWRHQQGLGDWQLKAGFTATRLDQETAGFITGLDRYRDQQLASQNPNPEAFRDTESIRGWAKFSRELGNGRLQITPFVRATDMDFRLHFLPGDPLEQNQQTGVGWQSSYSFDSSERVSWAFGVDGDFSTGELLQTQDVATRGSAFLRATIPTGVHYDYEVDASQLGAFAQLNLRASDRFSLIAGLRAERLEYDYDNRGLTGRTRDDGTECGFGGCRYSRPADGSNTFSDVSPKLELRYQVNDALRLHASASSAFRAPQATELYRLQRRQQLADLDSVQADNLELGVNYQADGLALSASVYQLDQRNLIIRDSDFFNVDGNRTQSKGLELALRYQFSDQWSWRAAATVAKHEYASDQISGGININGNEVDTAPNRLLNTALHWQPSAALLMELEAQHVSEYYLDPENLREYQGHTVLNLRSQYAFSDRIDLTLRVQNLSDKRYAERADFTSFTDERYFPGAPRSVFVGLTYVFDRQ